MGADGEERAETERGVTGEGGRHCRRGLAGGDHMERSFEQLSDGWARERARQSAGGTGAGDAGPGNGQDMGSERAGRERQWALCGSDQAESRVTTSNSLRSFATTWSASSLIESVSTCEITR